MTRGVLVVLAVLLHAFPAAAQTVSDDDPRVLGREVVVEPLSGASLVIDGRTYAGALTIGGHASGLAVVEETTLDDYLLGIREVPFSWTEEALKAQAVAARTYLAWTLQRGRSSNGRRFDYDICATAACQVYAGVGGVAGPGGERWRGAVESTRSEILLYEGRPAQALYSSTTSGRTRNVEDVFVGSNPLPYLRGVESPGEQSPFVAWSFSVDTAVMAALLGHAGLVEGELLGVTTQTTDDGEGPWMVAVEGTEGVRVIDTWTLRGRLNRAASNLFPDLFPVVRPGSDRRYPTTVLSPTYTIHKTYEFVGPQFGRPPELRIEYLVQGGGWGHDTGMSQYGAQAMGVAGATYDDILAHYYGSLRPEDGSSILPDRVRVGLFTERDEVTIVPSGPIRVLLDGEVVADGDLGSWTLTASDGRVLVSPPVGLGLPPAVEGWRIEFDDQGRAIRVLIDSKTAAEVRVVIATDHRPRLDTGFEVRDAGVIVVDLEQLGLTGLPVLTVTVEARSRLGETSATIRLLSSAE